MIYSQTSLMWPSKGTEKYGHRWLVNTGVIDMKCIVKGIKIKVT